jgi:hypothetical protein
MARINIFEILKYECQTHPADVIWDQSNPKHAIILDGDDPRQQLNCYVDFRSLVEGQGCKWEWYCEYHGFDSNDDKLHPRRIRELLFP